jgi:hypothetical protein
LCYNIDTYEDVQFAENELDGRRAVSSVMNKVNDLLGKTIAVIHRENTTGGAGDVDQMRRLEEQDAEGGSSRRGLAPRVLDLFAQTKQYQILEPL